jgi:hypothetical protein
MRSLNQLTLMMVLKVSASSLSASSASLRTPADPEAAAFVRRSLDSQDNPRFQEGAAAGGTDVFVWVADRAKAPNALFEHLTR